MYFLLKAGMLHCYVNLPKGIWRANVVPSKVYQILLNDFLDKVCWQKPIIQWIVTVCWLIINFLTFRLSFLLLVHLVFWTTWCMKETKTTQGHQYAKVQYKWATLASVWRHSTQYLFWNFDSTLMSAPWTLPATMESDYLPTVNQCFGNSKVYQSTILVVQEKCCFQWDFCVVQHQRVPDLLIPFFFFGKINNIKQHSPFHHFLTLQIYQKNTGKSVLVGGFNPVEKYARQNGCIFTK